MTRLTLIIVVCAAAAIAALTAGTWSSSSPAAASAKALESSLLAPCCWNGTLSSHDSPVATELRQEIETRADKGEGTAAIESDLVARYGERIRAMPKAGVFSNALVIVLDVGILALAAVLVTFARWRRTSVASTPNGGAAREPAAVRDGYDDRIDADLEDLEHV